MKYAWIAAQDKAYSLTEMCDVLDVSISGYRAWKRGGKPDRKRLSDSQMLALIRAIHAGIKRAYGSPRMVRELRARGFSASKARVERLMRDNGIYARHKRRYKVTTDSKHSLPVADNLLARNFTPTAPNQVWTSDITYLWTDEGWLYLAGVMDCYSRKIVGWSMSEKMPAELTCDALTMAIERRRPDEGLLHHSDRGVQYACEAYQALLAEHEIECSMSRTGDCYDNAMKESFWSTLKREAVGGIKFKTRSEARAVLFEYIEVFYNRKRRHSSLGYVSPERFEAA